SIYVLTKIGFRWAGIHQTAEEAEQNAQDMDIMIDSFKGLVYKSKPCAMRMVPERFYRCIKIGISS
ncbi:hypothetical protein B9M87_12165, partial [Staphylococcus agnetis]